MARPLRTSSERYPPLLVRSLWVAMRKALSATEAVGVLADVTNIRGQTREKTEKGSGTEAGSGKEVALGIRASMRRTRPRSRLMREKAPLAVRHQHAKVFKIQVMIVQSAYFISISQDIDIAHSDDPHMCVQYVNDIYSHLRESEEHQKPDPAYMERVQKDINGNNAGIPLPTGW